MTAFQIRSSSGTAQVVGVRVNPGMCYQLIIVTRMLMWLQVPMWDKFLKASTRALRPAKAMAATIITDCEELPSVDGMEVRQFSHRCI